VPHPKAAASRTRTPQTLQRGGRATARIVLDGTTVPPWPPQRQRPRKLPHGWRLLVLVDVRTHQVLEVRLTAAGRERTG
jgi:hypothetical protein